MTDLDLNAIENREPRQWALGRESSLRPRRVVLSVVERDALVGRVRELEKDFMTQSIRFKALEAEAEMLRGDVEKCEDHCRHLQDRLDHVLAGRK